VKTWKKSLGAVAVALGVAMSPSLTSPASATVLATDTVLLNDVEAHFGIIFDPFTWDAIAPAPLRWDYNPANQLWTPKLEGVLAIEGMAPGDCAEIDVDYFDGAAYLGTDFEILCSTGFGPQFKAVYIDTFASTRVDKVVIGLDLLTGSGWSRPRSVTRLLN
jgi:hypothetical protein